MVDPITTLHPSIQPHARQLIALSNELGDITKIVFWHSVDPFPALMEFRMWRTDDPISKPTAHVGATPSYTPVCKVTMTWYLESVENTNRATGEWAIEQDF